MRLPNQANMFRARVAVGKLLVVVRGQKLEVICLRPTKAVNLNLLSMPAKGMPTESRDWAPPGDNLPLI